MKKKYIIPVCKLHPLLTLKYIADTGFGDQWDSGNDCVKENVWGDSDSNGSSMWDLYDDQLNK